MNRIGSEAMRGGGGAIVGETGNYRTSLPSFPRQRESMGVVPRPKQPQRPWIPAFAEMTNNPYSADGSTVMYWVPPPRRTSSITAWPGFSPRSCALSAPALATVLRPTASTTSPGRRPASRAAMPSTRVLPAMRYGQRALTDAIAQLHGEGIHDITVHDDVAPIVFHRSTFRRLGN